MSETAKQYIWVAIGSAVGGTGRFWISGLVTQRLGKVFPWDILLINVTGSLIIGLLGALTAAGSKLIPELRSFTAVFFMTGVCGGYTTFSTFSLNTLKLARDGEWLYVTGYVGGSVMFCLLAVFLGWWLGEKITSL